MSRYKPAEVDESEIVKVTRKDGTTSEFVRIKDNLLSMNVIKSGFIPDYKILIPEIHDMNCRNDDIFLCAFPKSGTHWVWEIMNMLLTGNLKHLNTPKESAMLELHLPSEFDTMTSPRVLNSHLPFNLLPKAIKERGIKMVFIQRNPKDVAVSLYCHSRQMTIKKFDDSFADFIRNFPTSPDFGQSWYYYTKTWEKVFADNPDMPVHFVYYERLKKTPKEEINRLSEFLGCSHSQEFISNVADMCTFDAMKKAEQCGGKDMSDYQAEAKILRNICRKGIIGDWKNWFTVALNEEFDQIFNEEMKDSKFPFIFT